MIIDNEYLDHDIFGDDQYGFYANYSNEEIIKNKSHIEEIHFGRYGGITFYNNISQFQNLKKIKINLHNSYGFQRLASGIKELKKLGYDVDDVIMKLQQNLLQGDLTLPEGLKKESFVDD